MEKNGRIRKEMGKEIFTFASNLGGFHGAGSAKSALDKHGAKYGLGVGICGNSYAIPTKDSNIESLPLEVIELYVYQFLDYAYEHPEDTFNVVAVGCGLANFTPQQIAPMFFGAPENVNLPEEFKKVMGEMR